jgi:hypothetical protein
LEKNRIPGAIADMENIQPGSPGPEQQQNSTPEVTQ